MADYLVTDTELTSIANAIRTKGGTSASLEFPTEFVQAINDIQTGGGSKTNIDIGQATPANILNMFYALEQGTAKTGTFTLTTTLPNNAETLLFDTELTDVNGIAIFDEGYYSGVNTLSNYSAVQILVLAKALVPANISKTYAGFNISENSNNANASAYANGVFDDLDGSTAIRYGYFRLTNGALYAKGQYNKHSVYTPLRANTTYRWVAW